MTFSNRNLLLGVLATVAVQSVQGVAVWGQCGVSSVWFCAPPFTKCSFFACRARAGPEVRLVMLEVIVSHRANVSAVLFLDINSR
jgi:hypothetical protein